MNGLTDYITQWPWVSIVTTCVLVDDSYRRLAAKRGRLFRMSGPEPTFSDSQVITVSLIIETFFQGYEAVADLAQQRRRRNHRTTMLFQEVHQRTRSLHRWHLAIQIHPIHTFDVQRHMVAQQFWYRRHGRILLHQGYAPCRFLPSHSVSADVDTRRFEAKLR